MFKLPASKKLRTVGIVLVVLNLAVCIVTTATLRGAISVQWATDGDTTGTGNVWLFWVFLALSLLFLFGQNGKEKATYGQFAVSTEMGSAIVITGTLLFTLVNVAMLVNNLFPTFTNYMPLQIAVVFVLAALPCSLTALASKKTQP